MTWRTTFRRLSVEPLRWSAWIMAVQALPLLLLHPIVAPAGFGPHITGVGFGPDAEMLPRQLVLLVALVPIALVGVLAGTITHPEGGKHDRWATLLVFLALIAGMLYGLVFPFRLFATFDTPLSDWVERISVQALVFGRFAAGAAAAATLVLALLFRLVHGPVEPVGQR